MRLSSFSCVLLCLSIIACDTAIAGNTKALSESCLGVDGANLRYLPKVSSIGDASGVNGLTWDTLEPRAPRAGQHVYTGANQARRMRAAFEREDRSIQLNLSVLNQWALEFDPDFQARSPQDGKIGAGIKRIKPEHRTNWQDAVTHVVQTLGVRYLQIGSEAENAWASPEGYAEAVRLAYEAAKLADPEVVVMVGGFNFGGYFTAPESLQKRYKTELIDRKMDFVRRFLAAVEGNFDVFCFHANRSAADIPLEVKWIRESMKTAAVSRPIWIDDMTSGPWLTGPTATQAEREWAEALGRRDPAAIRRYEAAQAEYAVTKLCEAYVAGVEKVFISSDTDWSFYYIPMWRHQGLVREDQTAKPVFRALKSFAGMIEGFSYAERLAPGRYRFQFKRAAPITVDIGQIVKDAL
ncbi:MAG: hypothetical protein AAGB26_00180 [Planctomycetota bacterium]